jgi:hypothetical protein
MLDVHNSYESTYVILPVLFKKDGLYVLTGPTTSHRRKFLFRTRSDAEHVSNSSATFFVKEPVRWVISERVGVVVSKASAFTCLRTSCVHVPYAWHATSGRGVS